MLNSSIRLLTLTVFFGALVATPALVPALAAGGGDPGSPDIMRPSSSTQAPPADTKPANTRSSQKGKKAKQSFLDDPGFVRGYHDAYISIYDRHDYAAAIDELKALGTTTMRTSPICSATPIASSATTGSRRPGTSARSNPTRTTS